jgi:hypothetical protein
MAYRYEIHECPRQYGYIVYEVVDDESYEATQDCGYFREEEAREAAELDIETLKEDRS